MNRAATVILNFNGRRHLEAFLPSVVAHTASEVIVIDNGSTDDSVQYLKWSYPELQLVLLEENYGFAGGYNEGLKFLDHDIFILLNSDVEVTTNWDQPLLDALEREADLIACQPKVRSFSQRSHFEHAGACGGFLDSLGYAFCRGRVFDHVELDEGQYEKETSIHWATGAACAIRASAFRQFGGFDASYFAHYEEIDLCWRLRNLGYEIKAIPQSVVYHLGGGTLTYNSPNKVYLNFRNSLITLLKNNKGWSTWPKVILRMILDGVAAFKFLLEGHVSFFRAVFRAHGTFYGRLPNTLRKRRILKKERHEKTLPPPPPYPGLVILAFFLQKKRTFTALYESKKK